MKVTVLGKSPAWQDAGGACSGYLVEEGDFRMLVDCGNGVFAKLRLFADYLDIDAVVISHLHADHILDLIPFSYALIFSPRQQPTPVAQYPGTDNPARPALFVPPGACGMFQRVTVAWNMPDLIETAFDVAEYAPAETLQVGPLELRFQEVPHFIETFAIDVTAPSGKRLTYGADCRPNDALVDAAADTDLLIIESTLARPEREGCRGHLTPGEAGEIGRRAGAKRVVLTHIPDELDPEWAVREASDACGSEVEIAREGLVFGL